jgi:hypothetical protein
MRWADAEKAVLRQETDDIIGELISRPLLAAWSVFDIRRRFPRSCTPESYGYRYVRSDPSMALRYYARPWVIWAPLRLWEKLTLWCSRAVYTIYHYGWKHRLFYFKTPEWERIRWRDFRLGCDPFIARLDEREKLTRGIV